MVKTYFPHDSNARNSKKLLRLRKKHGAAGYGVYFMLIERLTEEPDFCSDLDYDMLAYELHVRKDLVKSVVENFELFDVKKCKDGISKFQSCGLLERMELRGVRSEAGKKGAAARWKSSPQPTDDVIADEKNSMANDGKIIANDDFANSKTMAKVQFANGSKEKKRININNNPFFYVFPFFFMANGQKVDLATLAYLMFCRNMPNAEKELEKIIAYNEVQGRKWEDMTIDQRVAAAQLWSPRTAAAKDARFSSEFHSFWMKVVNVAFETTNKLELYYALLCDAVKEGRRQEDAYILSTTSDVCEWMEAHIEDLKPELKKLLKAMGCKTFEYEITDKQEAI